MARRYPSDASLARPIAHQGSTRWVVQVAFENIPVPTLVADSGGTIVNANAAAAGLFERAPIGVHLREVAPELAARWSSDCAAARRGRVDGDAVWRLGVASRELRHAIIEVAGRFHIYLTAGVESIGARLESLGLVAGGIAHDFNNLLVGVLAEASAAREDPLLADPTREALRRIEAAARRMAQLTRQLLAFSGRAQFTTVPIVADELLGELRDGVARSMPSGMTLEFAPAAAGAVVEADPNLLRQVVLNLVANAVEAHREEPHARSRELGTSESFAAVAGEAGGPRVSVTSCLVARDGAPYWQLEVRDRGSGITTANLGRIFEPFFSTKPGHHGLGLSAVHGIVRRLGGEVDVESAAGEGARFRVQLPVALGPVATRPTRADAPSASKLTGVRVLVVDDEPSVRATVRRLLERRGATVVIANDGLEAEARIREETFHLTISDVAMPGLGGYEVLVTARRIQPAMRVILMSGYTEKLRGQGSDDEPDAFLEKPFTAKALDAMVDEVLKGRSG